MPRCARQRPPGDAVNVTTPAAMSPQTPRRRHGTLAPMSARNTPAGPNGEHDGEYDTGPADSLQIILGYARQSYLQQFATLDAYRARAASLLAFAAVLVAISAGTAQTDARSLLQASGTIFVLASAVIFLMVSLGQGFEATPSTRTLARSDLAAPVQATQEQLLRGTLDVLRSNQRILTRLSGLLSAGLLGLVAGTIIIGVRVTELLL